MKIFILLMLGSVSVISGAQAGTLLRGSVKLSCYSWGCQITHSDMKAPDSYYGSLFTPANEEVATYVQDLQDQATKSGSIELVCSYSSAYIVSGNGRPQLPIVYSLKDCKTGKEQEASGVSPPPALKNF